MGRRRCRPQAGGEPNRLGGHASRVCSAVSSPPTRVPVSKAAIAPVSNTRPRHGHALVPITASAISWAASYAHSDSPVGLLAWIIEKLWAWSDHGADLWSTFDRDAVLTNVMVYWLPNRAQSAARIYYEMEHPDQPFLDGRLWVPTGYLRMPKEPWNPPRVVAERVANIVHYTEAPHGGHFAAMEQPAIWADDVASFFGDRA